MLSNGEIKQNWHDSILERSYLTVGNFVGYVSFDCVLHNLMKIIKKTTISVITSLVFLSLATACGASPTSTPANVNTATSTSPARVVTPISLQTPTGILDKIQVAGIKLSRVGSFHFVYSSQIKTAEGDYYGGIVHFVVTTTDGQDSFGSYNGEWLFQANVAHFTTDVYQKVDAGWKRVESSHYDLLVTDIGVIKLAASDQTQNNSNAFTLANSENVAGQLVDHYSRSSSTDTMEIWVSQDSGEIIQIDTTMQTVKNAPRYNPGRIIITLSNFDEIATMIAPISTN